jgi:antirestriction protein ArdC
LYFGRVVNRTRYAFQRDRVKACYVILLYRIDLWPFEAFRDAEGYYAALAHETVHWTRHASRLAREFGRKRWGDEGYAMEELVAELGSAFLSADLDLTPEIRDDHAGLYCQLARSCGFQ